MLNVGVMMPDPRIDPRTGQLVRGMGTISRNPSLMGATQEFSSIPRPQGMASYEMVSKTGPYKKLYERWGESDEMDKLLSALILSMMGEQYQGAPKTQKDVKKQGGSVNLGNKITDDPTYRGE